MVSEWAIWSGYQVDSDAFKTLMGIIRGSGDPDLDQDLLDDYALDYIRWRRRLPRKEAAQSPKIRFRALDPEVDKLTHIFFPIRFIPFKSNRQLNDPTHPDYPIAHEETEKDKAKLERWLNYIHTKYGGEHRMSADQFEFTVMKDLHPLADWRLF
ncbi:hypothetical protein EV361DRAFT_661681 [Lentinula raphanica]|nr:hypothetical protein C8R42DRAFT_778056 [Lentinula raphanica]KAJ3974264.1 hypothetical protein EV361DRAFT_661681 [Lentinula raphanica]